MSNFQVFLSSLESGNFPDSGLPVAEILVLAGFLMIYLLEELLHLLLVKCGPLKEDEKSGGNRVQSAYHDLLVMTQVMVTAMARLFCQPRMALLPLPVASSSSSLSPSTTSLKELLSGWRGRFVASCVLPPARMKSLYHQMSQHVTVGDSDDQ